MGPRWRGETTRTPGGDYGVRLNLRDGAADDLRMRSARAAWGAVAGLILVVGGLALPGSPWASGSSGARARAHGLPVEVRDFKIRAPRQVAAGRVVFHVSNLGPDTHEFIVVRERPGRLPLRSDGLTVDEEALSSVKQGSEDGMMPGSSHTLDLRLKPGRYVLFCNMAGHYLAGMHTEIVAR